MMKLLLARRFALSLLIGGAAAVLGQPRDVPKRDPSLSVSKPEADNSTRAELNSFTIADGYVVELFADETNGVANPVAMSWDPAGRLWVLCTWAYPQLKPVEQPSDKLLILEDTDKDGRADRATIFADGLNMPTGFALGHGGVYLGEGTDLVHLADTDGDGIADTRRVVLTGFGTGDTHQNINSFTWGPGGELFFCQGLHAFSRVETPWGISRLDEDGTWRLRPLRLQLDPFSKTSSGANPWGIVFGNWGEPFVKSNSTGISELLPGMIHAEGTTRRRGGKMKIGETRIKSMILELAESPHLPDDIQGELLVAGYFARDVNRFQWERDSSGHRLIRKPDLMRSSHNAFRPVDIRIGPDGAIYIADWFNPIIGHYQASLRHPDRDKTRGRIWRVRAQGRPLANAPNFERMNADELCEELESDWRYVRYQSKRRLSDLPKETALPAVRHWLAGLREADPESERHLYEALGVFEAHEVVNESLLDRLLEATDDRARAYATRVLGRWHDRINDPLEMLDRMVADESPRVRLEAIVACSEIDSPESIIIAAKALNNPLDRFTRHALAQTTVALKAQWQPALRSGNLSFEKPEHLVFVLKETTDKRTVATVRDLLEAKKLRPDDTESLMALLVEIGNEDDLRWVLDRAGEHPGVLSEFAESFQIRQLKPAGDLAAPLGQIIRSRNRGATVHAIRLAGLWRVEGLADQILKVYSSDGHPLQARSAALESLGRLMGSRGLPMMREALDDSSLAIQQAALFALCEVDLTIAAEEASELLRETGNKEQAIGILTPFFEYENGLAKLRSELIKKPIASEIAETLRTTLAASGRHDAALDSWLLSHVEHGQALGTTPYSPQFVAALSSEVTNEGDADNGAKVFRSPSLGCIACHAVGGEGGTLGPELSAVGAGLPVDLLIESVLWPERQVKEGYFATTIVTETGEMASGYLESEDASRVVVRDAATGNLRTIRAAEIVSREDAGTLMPPGLAAGLSRTELRDLVRYLVELK